MHPLKGGLGGAPAHSWWCLASLMLCFQAVLSSGDGLTEFTIELGFVLRCLPPSFETVLKEWATTLAEQVRSCVAKKTAPSVSCEICIQFGCSKEGTSFLNCWADSAEGRWWSLNGSCTLFNSPILSLIGSVQ